MGTSMKANRIVFLAAALGIANAGSALAGALGGPPAPPTQTAAAMTGMQQSELNSTAYFVLPTIGAIIQQSLRGMGGPGMLADGGDGLSATHRGMAASADGGWPMQVWLDGNGGYSKNSLAVGGYSLTSYGTQAGIQAQITPTFLVGLGTSWLGTSGPLNGGFTSHANSFGLTPYIGWQFDEHWNVSGIAGYNLGRTSLRNAAPAYGADYDNDQWNFQGAFNGSYMIDSVRLSPTVSLLHVAVNNRSFVDSNGARVAGTSTALDRGSAGGALSLPMTGWEPYVRAAAEYDFSVPTGSAANGNAGGTVGVGTTIAITQAIWISFDAGYNSIGRTGLSLWSADARANLRF
jgi:hypothetical protein